MAASLRRAEAWSVPGGEVDPSTSEAGALHSHRAGAAGGSRSAAASQPALSFGTRSGLTQLSGVHISADDPRNHRSTQPAPAIPHSQPQRARLLADEESGGVSSQSEPGSSKPSASNPSSDPLMGSLYGLIAAVCSIPSMSAYSALIFSHDRFADHLPLLIRLTLLSACVHQCTMLIGSQLPWAIAQVQDAGIVYLATMALRIVDQIDGPATSDNGGISAEALATTLAAVSMATALTGAALFAIGKLRLAMFVQYLPLPVLAGFLAFIGIFLVESSINLVCKVKIEGLSVDLPNTSALHTLLLFLPAALGFALLLTVTKCIQHPTALPGCIAALPALFYICLAISGRGIENARAYGFIDKPESQAVTLLDVAKMFRFDLVQWSLLPEQLPALFGLIVCVAAGSLLDVAAIEASTREKLDYNRELATIGISNLTSGLLGGQTGSYLFGQSILIMHSGYHTRLTGVVVIILELIAAGLPTTLMAFLPRFLFGAVLGFIGWSITNDWLIATYSLLPRNEYLLLLSTAIVCHIFGIQVGLLTGLLACSASFVLQNASRPTASHFRSTGGRVLRDHKQRGALSGAGDRILELDFSGAYIFFGSASRLSSWIEECARSGSDCVILNFVSCRGIDASAARALAAMAQDLERNGILLLLVNVENVQWLLEAHGVIAVDGMRKNTFDSITDARKSAEDIVLSRQTSTLHRGSASADEGSASGCLQSIAMHIGAVDGERLMSNDRETLQSIEEYFREEAFRAGTVLYKRQEWPDALYVVAAGEIVLEYADAECLRIERERNKGAIVESVDEQRRKEKEQRVLSGPIGTADFMLRSARSHSATVVSETAKVYVLPLASYAEMQVEEPVLHAVVAEALAKCLAVELQHLSR